MTTLLDQIRAADPNLLKERDPVAIAAALSVGRTKTVLTRLTELGVRDNLSVVNAATFIRALREIAAATEAPKWLSDVLGAMGVPQETHWAYFDTLQCASPWLASTGLDVGSSKVQAMLHILAAGLPELAPACSAIDALSRQPDPVTELDVRRAAWDADGNWLGG